MYCEVIEVETEHWMYIYQIEHSHANTIKWKINTNYKAKNNHEKKQIEAATRIRKWVKENHPELLI